MEDIRELWQYYTDEPASENNRNVIDFSDDNNYSASLKFKQKKTGQTRDCSTKDVEIMVSLKHLSKFREPLRRL